MADFHQTDSIATLHRLQPDRLRAMEHQLEKSARHTGISLILPALITEFQRPAMRRICEHLRDTRYFQNIVVAVGRATRKQVEDASRFFDGFHSRVTILWMEDPRIQKILTGFARLGMPVEREGKGRTAWLSMGYLLAEGQSDVIALHDCDIVNYHREIPAALCYPLAQQQLGFDFCKGYYARVSDQLHGRVTRLFLAPLVRAMHDLAPDCRFLSFLSEFRYPLAGEFAMKASLARNLRLPADWGLEVGVLSEVFQRSGPSRVCQADIADNYEHKHQELSAADSSKGLRRMTRDIAGALLRCTELPAAAFPQLARRYAEHAAIKVRQYEADALMNQLRYDRGEESQAIGAFADSLNEAVAEREAVAAAPLPSWSHIQSVAPALLESLLEAVFAGVPRRRLAVPNWLQNVPAPAFSTPAP